MVEENLLHIELKRLKYNLHNSSQISCNLEQEKIELQKVVLNERRHFFLTITNLPSLRQERISSTYSETFDVPR